MIPLILVCLAAFLGLLWLLRRDRVSFGLPIAYLFQLLLIHVPGAFAHVAGSSFLAHSDLTEIGMRFTAIGSVCFVAGVVLARSPLKVIPPIRAADRDHFGWFCLLGGWFFTYGLTPFHQIPTLSALVNKGSAIWMLGPLLGLRAAFKGGDRNRIAIWFGALTVFPVVMLLLGGFLSYGFAAATVVLAALTISTRSHWRVMAGIVVITFLGLSLFVNYFQHRDDIREQVWGGAPLNARIESVKDVFRDFEWLDSTNQKQMIALDRRLNQNYFVGLAARRIEEGQVDYLFGGSVWDGLLSLIPRALWPEKTVFGGSPEIVAKMTGLHLSSTTSFGVGNIMEFQINFGTPGVIIGFLTLGLLIGVLDLKAATAERKGDLGRVPLFFLPSVALIQPGGSLVELFGGSAAAFAAALFWEVAWKERLKQKAMKKKGQLPVRAIHDASPSYRN